MSRKQSFSDSADIGNVSTSSSSTFTQHTSSVPSVPRTAPARTPANASRRLSVVETAVPDTSPNLIVSPPAAVGDTSIVEKQLFRSDALPPPADGVVGVVVRVRPLSTREHADPSVKQCVQCLKDSVIIGGVCVGRSGSLGTDDGSSRGGGGGRGPPVMKSGLDSRGSTTPAPATSTSGAARRHQFRADQVFHHSASQVGVYEQACRHVVEGVFKGINGSILAYGATGSGKTHTMFGGPLSAAGVVYQAVRDIFDEAVRLEEEEQKIVKVKCSFVEIYNEEVFDLLMSPALSSSTVPTGATTASRAIKASSSGTRWVNGRPALQVRDAGCSTSFSQAAEQEATRPSVTTSTTSATHASQPAKVKKQQRSKSSPKTNSAVNPESLVISGLTYAYPTSLDEFAHAIEQGHANRFTAATGANAHSSRSHAIITVEVQVLEAGQQGSGGGTVARLRFCDLAGSERAAATSNTGVRLREGGNINRSLLALGAVVQALAHQARYPNRSTFIPYRGSKLTRLLRDGIGGNCRTQMLFCLSPSIRQYEESVNTMLFAMQAKEIRVSAKRNEYNVNSAQVTKNQEEIIEELRSDLAAARDELHRLRGYPEGERPSLSRHSSMVRLGTVQDWSNMPSTVPAQNMTLLHDDGTLSPATLSGASRAVAVRGSVTSIGSSTTTTNNVSIKALPLIARPEGKTVAPPAIASSGYSNFPTVSELSVVIGNPAGGGGSYVGTPMSPPAHPLFDENALATTGESTVLTHNNTNAYGPGSGYSRGRSMTPSPGMGYGAGAAAGRPSVFHDSANLFSELEAKFKAFTEEKKTIYHAMRDTQEQHAQRDIELREHKWKLARFLASGMLSDMQRGGAESGAETTSGGTVVTPVGVAGLRGVIAEMESANAQEDTQMEELADKMDAIDRRIADSRRELLREKQYTALELLLDNASLRQNGTEAESLAAHYHQQWRSAVSRQEEYAEALEVATGALRAALQVLPVDSQAAEQSRLALVYAELPTTTTQEMMPTFERALRRQRPEPLHDGAKSVSILVPPSASHDGYHSRSTSGGAAGPLGMPPLPISHGFMRTPSSSLVTVGADNTDIPAAAAASGTSGNVVASAGRHAAAPAAASVELSQHFQELIDAANQLRTGGAASALPDGVVARGRRGSHSGQSASGGAVPAATRRPIGKEENTTLPPTTEAMSVLARPAEKPSKGNNVLFNLPEPSDASAVAAPASTASATTEAPSSSGGDASSRVPRKAKRAAAFTRSYSTSALQRDGGKRKEGKPSPDTTSAPSGGDGKKSRIMKSSAKAASGKKRTISASAAAPTTAALPSTIATPTTGSTSTTTTTAAPPAAALMGRRASAPASMFTEHAPTRVRVSRPHAAVDANKRKATAAEESGTSGSSDDPVRFRRTVTDIAKLSASPMTKLTAPSPEQPAPQTASSPRDCAPPTTTPVRENAASKLRQAAVLQAALKNTDPYLPAASPTRRDLDKGARKTKTKKSGGGGKKAPKAPADSPRTSANAGAATGPVRRRAHSAFSRSQTAATLSSTTASPNKTGFNNHGLDTSQAALTFGRRASSAGRAQAEKRAHDQEEHFQALFDLHEQILGGHPTPHRSRSALVIGGDHHRRPDEAIVEKGRNPSEHSSATGEEGLTDRPSA